tara:strand:- start:12 stop:695 length:684 start_codon:yes stop_codon:yes gene_type:complete
MQRALNRSAAQIGVGRVGGLQPIANSNTGDGNATASMSMVADPSPSPLSTHHQHTGPGGFFPGMTAGQFAVWQRANTRYQKQGMGKSGIEGGNPANPYFRRGQKFMPGWPQEAESLAGDYMDSFDPSNPGPAPVMPNWGSSKESYFGERRAGRIKQELWRRQTKQYRDYKSEPGWYWIDPARGAGNWKSYPEYRRLAAPGRRGMTRDWHDYQRFLEMGKPMGGPDSI